MRNKGRTLLTTIGIIIGVAAIVSLVSISDGIKSEALLTLGDYQYIILMEEGAFDEHLSRIDVDLLDRIGRVRGVVDYTATVNTFTTSFAGVSIQDIGFSGAGDLAVIAGINPEKADEFAGTMYYYDVAEGRMIKPGETNSILVTQKMLDDYDLFIGSVTEVNGENFRIIGTVKVEGSLGAQIDMIIMDADKAREITSYPDDKVGMVQVLPQDVTQLDPLITRLEETFEGELTVLSSDFGTEILDEFIGSLTIALWIVSGIAGVVGGIGVMNTMLMSVMERIQEFGVLKAIGWRNSHIIYMIVGEAVIIGLLGGFIGLFFGFIGSAGVEIISGIPTTVSPVLILQVLFFAMSIGVISSIYPAIIASRMSPVEAVTYE